MGPFSHLLKNLYISDAESHCDDKGWQRQTVRPNVNPSKDSPNIPVPSPVPTGLREVLPTVPGGFFVLPEIYFFASWNIIFHTPVPGRFHCPKAPAFLTFTQLLSSCHLAQFSVIVVQIFPFVSFDSFVDCLAESVSVCVNQWRSSPLKFNVLCVDEAPLRAHLVSPQRQLVSSFSDGRLWKGLAELRLLHPN